MGAKDCPRRFQTPLGSVKYMKFLLVPGNNSLSHIAKSLAIDERLRSLGHQTLLAATSRRARFLRELGRECAILPDLQENDDAGLPTVNWFNRPGKIAACIRAEAALMEEFRPDRVLGVFRFTLKAAAALAGVPYDSLTCGCMLPATTDVLGFAPGEAGADEQKQYLDAFYHYAGAKVSAVLRDLGLPPVRDVREMLQGERTFLWDFPEFMPVSPEPGLHHVGPLSWDHWPHETLDVSQSIDGDGPLAIVTFGTCVNDVEVAIRTVRLLVEMGYRVLLAAGGQKELLGAARFSPRVTVCRFAPLHLLFPHAALLVCHGGQMTVFEALAQKVPVLVMPLQPEQAHNGVCLERLGCGSRLLPPQTFRGSSQVYIDAFQSLTDAELRTRIESCTRRDENSLEAAQRVLARFDAPGTLSDLLVR